MPNRILAAIERAQQRLTDRLASGRVTQDEVDGLNHDLNMEFNEYVRFQELKSFAAVTGQLTMDEAQTVYMYLGESLDTFNGQAVAVKSVLTQLFGELLEIQIRKSMAG